MKYIKFFSEISAEDAALVGGKNANLGEMYNKLADVGVPVPNGFAVTAEGYDYFIKFNNLEEKIHDVLKGLDTHNIEDLHKRGEEIRNLIKSGEFPEDLKNEILTSFQKLKEEYGEDLTVAVRSSATAEDLPGASFAGQQETYLNVSEKDLLEKIKFCFASLFTDRAISYREDKGFDHFKVRLSVAVQKMVRSDVGSSGVMFTIDPDNGCPNVIVINSVFGLGELIVQGKVVPDEFMVFKPKLPELNDQINYPNDRPNNNYPNKQPNGNGIFGQNSGNEFGQNSGRDISKIIEKIDELTKGYEDKKQFYIDKLAEGIAKIGVAFWPNEVIVRFSDFKTNEYRNLIGGEIYESKEENPMIGWRGASRYYHTNFRKAFELEVLAFKRVREEMKLKNVVPMVPFCRTPDEGKEVVKIIRSIIQDPELKIYVMCEIPTNVLLANEFLEIFDGMSIGSNDLTQLVLGIDRDNEMLARIGDERNSAVLKMLEEVIKKCKEQNKYIGICGQAPSDFPEIVEFLVKNKIDSISVNPDAVIKTINLVKKAE